MDIFGLPALTFAGIVIFIAVIGNYFLDKYINDNIPPKLEREGKSWFWWFWRALTQRK